MADSQKSCGKCANFVRLMPDDPTAAEGRCQLKEWPAPWPMGYWPSMLAGDFCANGFKPQTEVAALAN